MPDPRVFPVYRLLYHVVCAMVERPGHVVIKAARKGEDATFTITVHPEDTMNLIGVNGKNTRALRTMIGAVGMKMKQRFKITIDDESGAAHPAIPSPRAPGTRV
jgi:predicted RNA-binding protein YlqC (UPF0109 family)